MDKTDAGTVISYILEYLILLSIFSTSVGEYSNFSAISSGEKAF